MSAACISNGVAPREQARLERPVSLTNDVPRWGPWAGRIRTGAETEYSGATNLSAIDTNGVVARFDLGISAESFNLIQTNQDLYLLDESEDGDQIPGQVLKLSHTLLKDYVGDLLITDRKSTRLNSSHIPLSRI